MRYADFGTIAEALDYAAQGDAGFNFYSGKGQLVEALPYRRLREQAMGLAARMLGAGLKPGDKVALIAESDGDFSRAFFACQYAGLVPAPLPLPAAFGGKDGYIAHLRRMVTSAHADALLGPAVLEAWLGEAANGLNLRLAGTFALLDTVPPSSEPLPAQDANALAYLQFSSGSTRFPLGVAVTQHAFMANAHYMARYGLAVTAEDRCTSWLPYYHDMGLVGFFLMPMACQLSVDILPTREFARRPLLWLDLIGRNRGTVSFSPSFGYELCLRRAETASIDGLDLSSWRRAGIGGDMVRPGVLTRFAERFGPQGFSTGAFVPCYGMAEATLALSFTPPGQGALQDVIDGTILEREHRAVPASKGTARTRSFVLCGRMLPEHEAEARGRTGADPARPPCGPHLCARAKPDARLFRRARGDRAGAGGGWLARHRRSWLFRRRATRDHRAGQGPHPRQWPQCLAAGPGMGGGGGHRPPAQRRRRGILRRQRRRGRGRGARAVPNHRHGGARGADPRHHQVLPWPPWAGNAGGASTAAQPAANLVRQA